MVGQKSPESMKYTQIRQPRWEKLDFSHVELELSTCMSVHMTCASKDSPKVDCEYRLLVVAANLGVPLQ